MYNDLKKSPKMVKKVKLWILLDLGGFVKMAELTEKKLLDVDEALNLNGKTVKSYYKEFMNPALANLLSMLNFDKKFIKAKGVEVWDENGNKYLDFLGGYGALNFGHNPDYIIEAVKKVQELPNILQASINSLAACLAYNLSLITPGNLNNCFFGNSGAEAVEGALKLSRAVTGNEKFIYCEGSFHGKTFGALSVTGRSKYQKPFKPLIPQCQSIPYGNLELLEEALKSKDVAAFIVEPIQGEGGIIVPPEGYLKKARELCTKYGALLIIDEIQTGLGRTGKMFACEWENVVPDVLCLAKSLGGSIMPIGAFITTSEYWKKAYGTAESSTLHTSTFGGNTWACAAGIAALNQLVDNDLSGQALEKGNYLLEKLSEIKNKYHIVQDVRGKGLMIGIEFKENTGSLSKLTGGLSDKLSKEYIGAMIAGELMNKHKIITAYTLNNPNVIRIEPPLIVEYNHLDTLVDALEESLARNNNFMKIAWSSSKTILKSLVRK
ncbi:MAG: putrescine aminotransferase [Clostridia bacterium]|nr:putrescine aminotransferase [Clostridia bacterium]